MYSHVHRDNIVCWYYLPHTGKLCLQSESLAKKCVAALARELEVCDDPVIRNNVVIIMCDLCIRLELSVCGLPHYFAIGYLSKLLCNTTCTSQNCCWTLHVHLNAIVEYCLNSFFLFRYTQLVDIYIGRISACLKDDSVLIRKQTLSLLTHLLQVVICEFICNYQYALHVYVMIFNLSCSYVYVS